MAEHRITAFTGTITWLGRVPRDRPNIRAEPVARVRASYGGFEDDYHGGLTRPACVRVKNRHARGTEIRNTRQLSILSSEEMAGIAADIGIERLDPALLGVSVVIAGIPDFTHVPPGARLQAPNGATIVIDVENGPCNLPAREIEKEAEGHGAAFKAAARGRRGVTAWIEREGDLAVGDELALFVPDQRAWAPGG